MTKQGLDLLNKLANKAKTHEGAAHLVENSLMELFAAEVQATIREVIKLDTQYDSIKCSCVGVSATDCSC